jgi:hypothetical protein
MKLDLKGIMAIRPDKQIILIITIATVEALYFTSGHQFLTV